VKQLKSGDGSGKTIIAKLKLKQPNLGWIKPRL